MGSRELKAQLGELDTNCSLSSFLKGIMRMADIAIDPFGGHDKKDTQPDETAKTIPVNPRGVMGGGGAS